MRSVVVGVGGYFPHSVVYIMPGEVEVTMPSSAGGAGVPGAAGDRLPVSRQNPLHHAAMDPAPALRPHSEAQA